MAGLFNAARWESARTHCFRKKGRTGEVKSWMNITGKLYYWSNVTVPRVSHGIRRLRMILLGEHVKA